MIEFFWNLLLIASATSLMYGMILYVALQREIKKVRHECETWGKADEFLLKDAAHHMFEEGYANYFGRSPVFESIYLDSLFGSDLKEWAAGFENAKLDYEKDKAFYDSVRGKEALAIRYPFERYEY